mmetsp:Transcript_133253/g.231132  ORF Transcript_133253/g.231132 Transcript_133253/m.231132 type:complete len:221 (-) Transcript_133253:182-844(-)
MPWLVNPLSSSGFFTSRGAKPTLSVPSSSGTSTPCFAKAQQVTAISRGLKRAKWRPPSRTAWSAMAWKRALSLRWLADMAQASMDTSWALNVSRISGSWAWNEISLRSSGMGGIFILRVPNVHASMQSPWGFSSANMPGDRAALANSGRRIGWGILRVAYAHAMLATAWTELERSRSRPTTALPMAAITVSLRTCSRARAQAVLEKSCELNGRMTCGSSR